MTAENYVKINKYLGDYKMAHVIDAMCDQAVRFRLDHAARFDHQVKFTLAHDIWGNWEIRNLALYELARSMIYGAAEQTGQTIREIQDIMIDVLPPGTGDYWFHKRGPGIPHQQAIFLMTPAENLSLTIYNQGPLTGQPRDELTVQTVVPVKMNQWIEVPSINYWNITADDQVYASIFSAYFTVNPVPAEPFVDHVPTEPQ